MNFKLSQFWNEGALMVVSDDAMSPVNQGVSSKAPGANAEMVMGISNGSSSPP